jgi:hypothetical protein
MTKVYQALASLVDARLRSAERGNWDWVTKHEERIKELVEEHLPSGSGFDAGSSIDLYESKPERLVFGTAFHHMSDHGYYVGWSEHNVIVTPSLLFGFNLRVTGRDRNQIKDYIGETFQHALDTEQAGYLVS